MISFTSTPETDQHIYRVTLIDTEDAAKLGKGQGVYGQVGNHLWRSPEAHAATNVRKAPDIWSFGLTVSEDTTLTELLAMLNTLSISQGIYGIIKRCILAYNDLEEGVLPEVEVLANMLSYFGPLSLGLFEHVKSSPWSHVLVQLDLSFDEENRRTPFRLWQGYGLQAEDKAFFGRILNLDPGKRPSADELLLDPWFSTP